VTYVVFADNLSQSLNDLFGVFPVRVHHPRLVAGLRPSTDLDWMNFLASHFVPIDDMAKPEDEDTRRVRIRKAAPIGCVAATPDSAPFQTFPRPPEF
jgi:hypothetical protein